MKVYDPYTNSFVSQNTITDSVAEGIGGSDLGLWIVFFMIIVIITAIITDLTNKKP